jgi:predicted small secreted protein
MIQRITIIAVVALVTLAIGACTSTSGPGGKIGNKIDDALDARPGEKVRDTVEKITN